MDIRLFDALPEEAVRIRTEVFMEEQGFKNEFDEIDERATHFVAVENSTPVAVCRLYYSIDRKCYVIGRIAVLKDEWRTKLWRTL